MILRHTSEKQRPLMNPSPAHPKAREKDKTVKEVCFAKDKWLAKEDMCRSNWFYKALRKFRAGIESGISWLKRCFGLKRYLWKEFDSFKSYVWSAILSANLLTIGRKQLA